MPIVASSMPAYLVSPCTAKNIAKKIQTMLSTKGTCRINIGYDKKSFGKLLGKSLEKSFGKSLSANQKRRSHFQCAVVFKCFAHRLVWLCLNKNHCLKFTCVELVQ